MSNDPQSHDWARNRGEAILGINPERRRNLANGGDRRVNPEGKPPGTAPDRTESQGRSDEAPSPAGEPRRRR